jgi:predicted cobalt transporter CbtA
MARTMRAIPPRCPVIDLDYRALKRILAAALPAGLIAGLLLTAIQQFQVAPLIRAAEAFEAAHDAAPSLLATAAANVVLATAFALLLGAALSLRPASNWRIGMLWGAAGYAVFFVAPSLGLPPELPGTQAAALHERQLWWVGAVACAALGLWIIAFGRKPVLRVAGALLLVAPHVLGAPQPAMHGGTAPAALLSDFVRATYLANAIFWLALGALVGRFLAQDGIVKR